MAEFTPPLFYIMRNSDPTTIPSVNYVIFSIIFSIINRFLLIVIYHLPYYISNLSYFLSSTLNFFLLFSFSSFE